MRNRRKFPITMTRLAVGLFAAALLWPGCDLLAQQLGGRDSRSALWSREAMIQQLEKLEQLNVSPESSGERRAQYRLEAELIRERLEHGDLRVGDRVIIYVEGEEVLTDTFTVNADRALDLPQVGAIPMAGVLRSELESHLQTHIDRFIRDPVVRVGSLIRLTVLGAVNDPGFYTLSWEALVGDVLMVAGGPSGNAAVDKLRIERRGQRLWGGEGLQDAMIVGFTLDQLNLRPGDEIYVPRQGRFWENVRNVSLIVSIPASIAFLIVRIF